MVGTIATVETGEVGQETGENKKDLGGALIGKHLESGESWVIVEKTRRSATQKGKRLTQKTTGKGQKRSIKCH